MIMFLSFFLLFQGLPILQRLKKIPSPPRYLQASLVFPHLTSSYLLEPLRPFWRNHSLTQQILYTYTDQALFQETQQWAKQIKIPALVDFTFQWGETHSKNINTWKYMYIRWQEVLARQIRQRKERERRREKMYNFKQRGQGRPYWERDTRLKL